MQRAQARSGAKAGSMAKKMPRSLVALSSTAIAAIYLAGYLGTQQADAGLNAAEVLSAPAVVTPRSGFAPRPAPFVSGGAPGNVAPASPATYRDGVYHGAGTSRRGGFRVAVTIAGGRISDVVLTEVTTQYPASRIAALPGQVVARQSAQVDRITGATYSVSAFQSAVQLALAQAAITAGGAAQSTTPASPQAPVTVSPPTGAAARDGRDGFGERGGDEHGPFRREERRTRG